MDCHLVDIVWIFLFPLLSESQLTRVTILGAVFWLVVLIAVSASDVFIRARPEVVGPLGTGSESP